MLVWARFGSSRCGWVRSDSPSSGHGWGHGRVTRTPAASVRSTAGNPRFRLRCRGSPRKLLEAPFQRCPHGSGDRHPVARRAGVCVDPFRRRRRNIHTSATTNKTLGTLRRQRAARHLHHRSACARAAATRPSARASGRDADGGRRDRRSRRRRRASPRPSPRAGTPDRAPPSRSPHSSAVLRSNLPPRRRRRSKAQSTSSRTRRGLPSRSPVQQEEGSGRSVG